MTARLFLGCGSFGRTFARQLRSRPGSLLVLTDDEDRVEALRDENVRAETLQVADASAVRERVDHADTVVLAHDDPARNVELAAVAREVFPDAFCLAYAGKHASGEQRDRLGELADDVVDEGLATARTVWAGLEEAGYRTRRLQQVLRRSEGPLAVVTHDNPDPDAIASGFALKHVAERVGLEAEVIYYGNISHQENRAFVNLLEYDLTNLADDADLSRFGSFALVDHSRPGVNDGLPPETEVAVVVDHHPPRAPVEARFVDLRSDVGATSTLLTDHLRRLGIEPDRPLATGLLFGIQVDTRNFTREVSPADFDAAAHLAEHVDLAALERIEAPSMSVETLETIGAAIDDRELRDGILVTCVGEMSDRDALAQAADKLLDMEGVSTTFVFGYTDEMVYASARARGNDVDLGETLREAFDQVGSAGGHADMAGAQLPVGILVDEADEDPATVIREVVTDRFFEVLGAEPNLAATAVYADSHYMGTGEPLRFEETGREDGDSMAASRSTGERDGEDSDGGADREAPEEGERDATR